MNKTYYECHVTFTAEPDNPRGVHPFKAIVEGMGWVFSSIAGDANLGPGRKLYATKQLNARVGDEGARKTVLNTGAALRDAGAKVLREKVEVVIFDTRSSKVQACTDCAACQEARG